MRYGLHSSRPGNEDVAQLGTYAWTYLMQSQYAGAGAQRLGRERLNCGWAPERTRTCRGICHAVLSIWRMKAPEMTQMGTERVLARPVLIEESHLGSKAPKLLPRCRARPHLYPFAQSTAPVHAAPPHLTITRITVLITFRPTPTRLPPQAYSTQP